MLSLFLEWYARELVFLGLGLALYRAFVSKAVLLLKVNTIIVFHFFLKLPFICMKSAMFFALRTNLVGIFSII